MSQKQNGIWIGSQDLNKDPEFIQEAQLETKAPSVVDAISDRDTAENIEGNRRDFLKFLGFGLGAATIAAGCDVPVKRAIPYIVKPETIIPGVATYYASSIVKGGDYCSVLVKTREGRPIKIEGNKMSSVTRGGTSARAQAAVLDLYDINRYKKPQIKGADGSFAEASWSDVDTAIKANLVAGKSVRVVSNTILSPTTKKLLGEAATALGDVKVVQYDPVSSAAMLKANEASLGQKAIPAYHFDKAEYIVSVNADFLGTWISPTEYAKAYTEGRKINNYKKAKMSRHVQVESHMSLTGSNADHRILVKPSAQSAAVAYLYNKVAGGSYPTNGLDAKTKKNLDQVAKGLKASAGKSLVVSGNNDVSEQLLVNGINHALGNYGQTLSMTHASLQRQGDESELADLIKEMNAGQVDVLLVNDANPVYEYANGEAFKAAMAKVKTKVAFSYRPNETSVECDVIAPVHHTLESWGDAEPKRGQFGLVQPTISPLFDTRQMETSIMMVLGSSFMTADQPYYEYLKDAWKSSQFTMQSKFASFDAFWNGVLYEGVFEASVNNAGENFSMDAASINVTKPSSSGLELSFTEPISTGNGTYADNPWLQEMPDPVTRTSWGNYLSVPIKFDGIKKFSGYNDLKDGDLVTLTIGDKSVTLPVIQQFGQMPGTISVALGGGRDQGGFAVKGIGKKVNDLLSMKDGLGQYMNANVSLSNKVGEEEHFSCVQYHHTMGVTDTNEAGETKNADEAALAPGYGNIFEGYQGALVNRSIIRTAELDTLSKQVHDLEHEREHHNHLNENTLYPFDEYTENLYRQGHHWGMHIDMNACTGCGACTVACMSENNVPVVGKERVAKHQEMTWLRIDRYYFGEYENPNTVYQPLMCQHCDNAPCENVCPVNATNHSSEGLNQMTYNRCIGTRYCANNCPYKVRRFNWLDYTTADIFPANQVTVNGEEVPFGADNLTRMVLNPDVTVRTRGVIEKCSFCVQRIQEAKLTAKSEGRRMIESDLQVACASACPTEAITFGDRNDKESKVAKQWDDPRVYEVLEEVNVRSSVRYAMKVVNKDHSIEA